MKQSAPSDAEFVQKTAEPVRSSPSKRAFAPTGRLAQLAEAVNQSSRPRTLAQLQDAVQQASHVPNLIGLAAEINQGKPAQLRGVPVNDDAGLEQEADVMAAKAMSVQRQPAPSAEGDTSTGEIDATQLEAEMSTPNLTVREEERPQTAQMDEPPVQRIIGDAGAANTGRVAFDKDNVIAKVQGVEPPKYLGAAWPKDPVIYKLAFFHDNSGGFALGQDPNYFLADKEKEADYLKEYGKRTGNLIPLRSPVLQGLANGTYVLSQDTGKIKPGSGGEYADGKHSFVILTDGALSIAPDGAVGHTGLAKGNAVLMAGELMITAGKAAYHSCQTGHYYTRPNEEERGIAIMKESYSWIRDLRTKGPEGEGGLKGLAVFGAVIPGSSVLENERAMKKDFKEAKALWDKHKAIWVVDVLMQSIKETIKKHQQIFDDADELTEKIIKELKRKVEITAEMLRDMKEAIEEHALGKGAEEKKPAELKGYDGTDPFEE